MGFSLGVLFEVAVLFINAVAILHEDRFLKKIGWGHRQDLDLDSVKDRIISFLHAVRLLMRIPLIFINLVVVVWELLLG